MENKNNNIIPFAILGISFLLGVTIFVFTWKSNYNSNQVINVTGSAKREIVSDLGVIKGTVSVESATADAAYKELKRQIPLLLDYLASKGFPADKVDMQTINSYPVYQMGANGYTTNIIRGYIYNQRFQLSSTDVQKIKAISLDLPSVVERGVSLQLDMPEYHYTKLSDLKIEIQAEAAKDAKTRAEKIARATDREIGPLRDAKMGVIQITPRLSNQVSDYGINDLSSIDKEITAVVNASFIIK
jgi:uncharacterized protein